MKNGRQLDAVDYLTKFDWNMKDSNKFRQTLSQYQAQQRDGTHEVLCAWRSFKDDEIEAEARKVCLQNRKKVVKNPNLDMPLVSLFCRSCFLYQFFLP